MGDIVNLRRAGKQAGRKAAEQAANANRVAFGRPKQERAHTAAEKALGERRLSGHLLDGAPPLKPDGADGDV